MKLKKLLVSLVTTAAVTSLASAATVTVASGLSTQGFTPSNANVAIPNFFFAVGNYNTLTSTWTQFGTSVADTGKVGGAGGIVAFAPASLNGLNADLFVGTGSSIGDSGTTWVIMRSSATTAFFPSDVSGTGSVTLTAAVPTGTTGWTFLAKGDAGAGFGGAAAAGGTILNLAPIPEPSAAMLGVLGGLALLRRRRN